MEKFVRRGKDVDSGLDKHVDGKMRMCNLLRMLDMGFRIFGLSDWVYENCEDMMTRKENVEISRDIVSHLPII